MEVAARRPGSVLRSRVVRRRRCVDHRRRRGVVLRLLRGDHTAEYGGSTKAENGSGDCAAVVMVVMPIVAAVPVTVPFAVPFAMPVVMRIRVRGRGCQQSGRNRSGDQQF